MNTSGTSGHRNSSTERYQQVMFPTKHTHPPTTSTQGVDHRMYTITLMQGTWCKRLYFSSTFLCTGRERFRSLHDRVELIGANATSMEDYSGRVTALLHAAGFVRIQK